MERSSDGKQRRARRTGRSRSRPTLEDVAAEAGVSRQTVSNVINAPERVSERTRRETEAAIERLGYRSHVIARNLRQRSSRMIGYRVPRAQQGAIHPVLDRFLHALTAAARAQGNSVLLFVADEHAGEAAIHEEMLSTSAVDGVVLSDTTPDDGRVEFLARQGLPFVSFGRTRLEVPHAWVDVDGALGTRAAVGHMAANGHRRIAYLDVPNGFTFSHDRRRGYAQGLEAASLVADPALDVAVADEREAVAAVGRLLTLDDPATAVVAASDMLALAAIKGARSHGTVASADGFAVVGFDDTPTAPMLTPALTSVRQPLEQVAGVLVRLLADQIRGAGPEGVLLEPTLIVRESA